MGLELECIRRHPNLVMFTVTIVPVIASPCQTVITTHTHTPYTCHQVFFGAGSKAGTCLDV